MLMISTLDILVVLKKHYIGVLKQKHWISLNKFILYMYAKWIIIKLRNGNGQRDESLFKNNKVYLSGAIKNIDWSSASNTHI